MTICANVTEEAERLVDAGAAKGITLRLLGGMAVRLHSPSASHRALERKYPDIDLVVPGKNRMDVQPFLVGEGYAENKTFNTLSGSHRQLFYDTGNNRQIDVFIGGFEMCHKLPIADRLNVEPLTIPLAELFLTKAQIVTLNRKDVLDLVALLLDHEVGAGDRETINSEIIAELCARDWGLYTTATMNMQKVRDMVAQGEVPLEEQLAATVAARLAALKESMDRAPKALAWKMRARMGTACGGMRKSKKYSANAFRKTALRQAQGPFSRGGSAHLGKRPFDRLRDRFPKGAQRVLYILCKGA